VNGSEEVKGSLVCNTIKADTLENLRLETEVGERVDIQINSATPSVMIGSAETSTTNPTLVVCGQITNTGAVQSGDQVIAPKIKTDSIELKTNGDTFKIQTDTNEPSVMIGSYDTDKSNPTLMINGATVTSGVFNTGDHLYVETSNQVNPRLQVGKNGVPDEINSLVVYGSGDVSGNLVTKKIITNTVEPVANNPLRIDGYEVNIQPDSTTPSISIGKNGTVTTNTTLTVNRKIDCSGRLNVGGWTEIQTSISNPKVTIGGSTTALNNETLKVFGDTKVTKKLTTERIVTDNIDTDSIKRLNIQASTEFPQVVIGNDDVEYTNESLMVNGKIRTGRLVCIERAYFATDNDKDPIVFIGKAGVPASNTSLAVQGSAAITGRLKVGNLIITEYNGKVRFVINGKYCDLTVNEAINMDGLDLSEWGDTDFHT
jgi:hypothetical protein